MPAGRRPVEPVVQLGARPFHMDGCKSLPYDQVRDSFTWTGAGPFHMDGRDASPFI